MTVCNYTGQRKSQGHLSVRPADPIGLTSARCMSPACCLPGRTNLWSSQIPEQIARLGHRPALTIS